MGLQGGGEGTTNFNVCEREEDRLGHTVGRTSSSIEIAYW